MAVRAFITRNGQPHPVFQGVDTNIESYSVQEDATTVDVSNFNGGFGQITLNMSSVPDSLSALSDEIRLTDNVLGNTRGIIRDVTDTDGALVLVADSSLGLFDADHIVNPQTGTLKDAFEYYVSVAGINNNLIVDPAIAARPVKIAGWNGNMWDNIKQILAAHQIEMSLVFEDVVVRPLRKVVANTDRETSKTKAVNNQNTTREIEVFYYNHTEISSREVYPWNIEEPSVYTVNANETVTVRLEINASLSSVNQPVVTSFVPNYEVAAGNGVYSVAGNDGLPITPAQWTAQGGDLVVRLVEPSVLEVDITGARMEEYAPYRIAMTAGTSSYYNSLRITGTGLRSDKKSIVLKTGSTAAVTGDTIGVTVDSPYINTLADAYNVGIVAAGKNALQYAYSASSYNINRTDGDTQRAYSRIQDFNDATPAGTTIDTFNIAYLGQTIQDFNDYWDAAANNTFENQAFGNVSGARVLDKDCNFRIVNATVSPAGIEYSAELDTTIDDFNEAWAGKTIADFNTERVGDTMQDFSLTPIRRNT